MSSLIEIVISVFILIGVGLNLLASLGLLRLPDVYTRLHAATKSATLGVMALLTAGVLYFAFEDQVFVGKMFLGIIFVFLTSPVSGHMIARAAYKSGVSMSDKSVQDDLEYSDSFTSRSREEHTEG